LLIPLAASAALVLTDAGRHPDVFPPIEINHTTVHYAVEGNSIGRLRGQLRRHHAPGVASGHGRTSSAFQVESMLETGDDRCILAGLKLSVDIVTTLPEWQATPRAGQDMRRQWLDALRQLERHEDRHRQHATEAAQDLRADLLDLPVEKDCLRMQMRMDGVVRRATWKLRMRDRFFDERTQGGLVDETPAL
jgi:predicted secreted Zn-dependent protease